VSVYRRGKIYWYKFWFANKLIRESAKTSSKTLAKEAEKKRRRELEAGYNNLSQDFRNQRVLTLRQAADKYSADYTIRYPSSSVKYQKYCVNAYSGQVVHSVQGCCPPSERSDARVLISCLNWTTSVNKQSEKIKSASSPFY
jgi:hypothetical protein